MTTNPTQQPDHEDEVECPWSSPEQCAEQTGDAEHDGPCPQHVELRRLQQLEAEGILRVITDNPVRKLAQDLDTEGSYETDSERLFGLLVEVAKEYVQALENEGERGDRTSLIDSAVAGLTENLDIWEEETL